MKRCPTCKSVSRSRRTRKAPLKFIPFSKAYSCQDCNTRYLYFQPLAISIKIRKRR